MIGVRVFQGYPQGHAPFGLCTIDRGNGPDLLKLSGLRHSSAYGLQVALLAMAARAAVQEVPFRIEPRRALITNGGPWAVETALGFLKTAQERGPQFANPLLFPATLMSAGASAVGSLIGAGAAAIAIGHDELAFFEILRRSRQLVFHGLADHVIAAAACAPSAALTKTLKVAGLTAPAGECSVAFRLEHDALSPFILEEAAVNCVAKPWSDVPIRVDARVTTSGSIECLDFDLGKRPLLSAASAVLCALALNRHLADAPAGTTMVVSCCRNGIVGAARFRRGQLD